MVSFNKPRLPQRAPARPGSDASRNGSLSLAAEPVGAPSPEQPRPQTPSHLLIEAATLWMQPVSTGPGRTCLVTHFLSAAAVHPGGKHTLPLRHVWKYPVATVRSAPGGRGSNHREKISALRRSPGSLVLSSGQEVMRRRGGRAELEPPGCASPTF